MGGQRVDITALLQHTFPTPERGHVRTTFVNGTFSALKSGGVQGYPLTILPGAFAGLTVVGGKNHERVIPSAPLIEFLHEQPKIIVNILDHAITTGRIFVPAVIEKALLVTLRGDHGTMRRVGRDESKVGSTRLVVLFDKTQRRLKEHISAEALGLDDGVVFEDHVIEVFALLLLIRGEIGTTTGKPLPDSPRAVNKHIGEAAIVGLVFVFIAKVPLSKDAGAVT